MKILLSGATGLVGGALTGHLLDKGHEVHALLRGMGRQILDMNGRNRIHDVQALQGDITLPDWGLAHPPDTIEMVVHCAATTDFGASDETYKHVNIGGTKAAIALARYYNAPLLHVSTAYVCGKADGTIPEEPASLDRQFTNGYERSKAEAEIKVMDAVTQGLVAAIARPSIIVGRLCDGKIAKQDDFYKFFRLFGSPLLGQVPAINGAALAIVPICHVVDGIMAMIDDIGLFAGEAVHLVAQEPFPLADMLALVGGYPKASPAQLVPVENYDPTSLDRRQAMVHNRVGVQFFEYFKQVPHFSGTKLTQRANIAAPVVDRAALKHMVDYCHATDFLDWE